VKLFWNDPILCLGYPDNLEIFWSASTSMKMSKEKLVREKMVKFITKLLGQSSNKERK
jgi:hypothetical protein